jgi:hypothetical protein
MDYLFLVFALGVDAILTDAGRILDDIPVQLGAKPGTFMYKIDWGGQ